MIYIIIGLVIVIFDQFTKAIIVSRVEMFHKIPVIKDFFYITYVENTGAAWSIFEDSRLFLILISIVLIIFLTVVFIKNNYKFFRIILSIVIGGALGNLIDRIFSGSVIDFLDFYIFGYDYPVFNIADIAIVIGSILMAYYMLFLMKEEN